MTNLAATKKNALFAWLTNKCPHAINQSENYDVVKVKVTKSVAFMSKDYTSILITLWFSTTIGDNAKVYSFSPVLGE